MGNQRIIIESLAMDLKRVALGRYRGSSAMANRFKEEALKRESELRHQQNPYLTKLLDGIKLALSNQDRDSAEDLLMYSTLFQNFALKIMGG